MLVVHTVTSVVAVGGGKNAVSDSSKNSKSETSTDSKSAVKKNSASTGQDESDMLEKLIVGIRTTKYESAFCVRSVFSVFLPYFRDLGLHC